MLTYEVNKINDNLYSIREDITDNNFPVIIYLVIGKEKAALIDTGLGTDNLKALVSTITNLPILVLHTHGHGDHIGADALFTEIYLNNKEDIFSQKDENLKLASNQRISFIKKHLKNKPLIYSYIQKHIVKDRAVEYKNIQDGDIINLGELELTAVSTPGHTLGSISYINQRDKYAFTGDGIADIHWFDNEENGSVEDFFNTLNHFESEAKDIYNIYAAHIPNPFTLKLIHDLKHAAASVLEGAQDEMEDADYQFLIHGRLYAHRCGNATIYYNKENIYSRDAAMK
ncbi:MBL fold metallo-hydrolase [Clostridium sp. 19966]|uniref:MBL fold metallo-hydrolase n=1 Tax=Clostridium sp. 19966 TaxID=2768166 RepID=UPI0028DD982C|nr:MBL fold metallo-hydrolase [Clostridium sp. 19966]MDT8718168.1 MBL fold metallo-hydrolase [Clostridium sp. 19966]